MSGNISSILLALVGLVGVVTGLYLVISPARSAATMELPPPDALAQGQARFTGVRNVAAGALLLWAGYALGMARLPGAGALAVAVGVMWAAVQAADVVIFWRMGSRVGAFAALALAILAAVTAALAL